MNRATVLVPPLLALSALAAVQPTASAKHPIPTGRTYLMAFDSGGSAFGFVIVRKGATVKYAWSPSAGHPNCFRGRYDSGQLVGERVTENPAGPVWSSEPLQIRIGKRAWRIGPHRYFQPRPGTKRHRVFAKRMDQVLSRCSGVTWPSAAPPTSTAQPPESAPPTIPIPPAPQPSTPPPPPPPGAAITGNPCTTAETEPNCAQARVSQAPNNSATKLGSFSYGQVLMARCWTTGQVLTDGNNADPSDDARTFTSGLWFGIDWNGGRGYVAATWTTKSENHLSLPNC